MEKIPYITPTILEELGFVKEGGKVSNVSDMEAIYTPIEYVYTSKSINMGEPSELISTIKVRTDVTFDWLDIKTPRLNLIMQLTNFEDFMHALRLGNFDKLLYEIKKKYQYGFYDLYYDIGEGEDKIGNYTFGIEDKF